MTDEPQLPKVQPDDGTGSATGDSACSTGGATPLLVPLPVPAPALLGKPL
jgi:hypothetical protein